MKIRILIADDHAIVRYGLASLAATQSDMEIVGEAKNGQEAVRLAAQTKPDVILMDLMMPKLDGAEASLRILKQNPAVRILILTSFGAADGIARALDAGAAGALMKTAEDAALLPAIRDVAHGKTVISSEIRKQLDANPPAPELTKRQMEILISLQRGLSNIDIARQLGIRKDSVEEHIRAIFSKLGAANRTEAVAIAMHKHLLKI